MSSMGRRVSLGVFSICALAVGFAASSAIGLVVANGSFQLEHSKVRGSATLFDGNLIETNASSPQLRLNNGTSLRLAAESRARVYPSRLVLEQGTGQLESTHYRIEAAGLRIETDRPGTTARVLLDGPRRVVVAARDGSVRISNTGGILIARLDSGREMTFEPQVDIGTLTKVSGILAVKDGKFIVVDRITNVTMQVQGAGLEAVAGNLVEITGTVNPSAPVVAGASQLIDVTSIKRLMKGGAGVAAGVAGAGAAGAAAGGLSIAATVATVAIVGGVAAAGTIGGLAAAHALPGQGSSPPSTSR
ncbi:MAG TPA: hypothetical protein VMR62_07895 [Bryobacteraceae bacterium]|jgi:hypothetical protein|nr:hypothetical protein [Bryobacteraceae bacterium]